ncbi:MAG: DUF1697 domain-containing protein [Gemmatimonadetes bacterium]|nr:DUF1697 domain-containing protein [Gemmatimonadota bacterium]
MTTTTPENCLVAFLRGINLGKRRVKMADLRAHFETMDLNGVATFIASGNVIFDGAQEADIEDLERRLEEHLEERLGFYTDVIIRKFDEVARITRLPLVSEAEKEGFTVHVFFAGSELNQGAEATFRALETPDDGFRVIGREVLWLRRGRLTDSTVKAHHLQAAFGGVANTARKMDTLRRLVVKFGFHDDV